MSFLYSEPVNLNLYAMLWISNSDFSWVSYDRAVSINVLLPGKV